MAMFWGYVRPLPIGYQLKHVMVYKYTYFVVGKSSNVVYDAEPSISILIFDIVY